MVVVTLVIAAGWAAFVMAGWYAGLLAALSPRRVSLRS